MKDLSSIHLKAITLQMKFHSPPGNLFCRWGTAETTASVHQTQDVICIFPDILQIERNFIFILLVIRVLKMVLEGT